MCGGLPRSTEADTLWKSTQWGRRRHGTHALRERPRLGQVQGRQPQESEEPHHIGDGGDEGARGDGRVHADPG